MAFPARDQDDRELNILAAERFVGTVRVAISCLQFLDARQLDPRVVKELVSNFQQTRCRRYESENFIPVLITKSDLDRALRVSDINRTDLKTPDQEGSFRFLKAAKRQNFTCVYGQHRIRAAEQFLDPRDRWWPVKLFIPKSKGRYRDSNVEHANS
jgi:hypothetical protein